MTSDPRFAPLPYVDRKPSLVFFGILTLLTGIVLGLFAWFIFKTQSASATPNFHAVWPAVSIYGTLAVAFVWLGIGSIMARRWARALLLIVSWAVLAFGVLVIATMAALWPAIYGSIERAQAATASANAAAVPPGGVKWAILGGVCVGFFLLLVLPSAIGAFFYSRKSVKATCEARNPAECWTDRAPLPVIAAVLFQAFGVVSLVGTALGVRGASTFFGTFISGLPGFLFYGVLILLWAYSAVGMYRLNVRAWWIALACLCVMPVSSAITFQHHSVTEFFQNAGYAGQQMAFLQQNPMFSGNGFVWMTLAGALPWIVYLLCIKRYFRRA